MFFKCDHLRPSGYGLNYNCLSRPGFGGGFTDRLYRCLGPELDDLLAPFHGFLQRRQFDAVDRELFGCLPLLRPYQCGIDCGESRTHGKAIVKTLISFLDPLGREPPIDGLVVVLFGDEVDSRFAARPVLIQLCRNSLHPFLVAATVAD